MGESSKRLPGLVLLGLLFAGMGGLFCYLMVVDYVQTLRTYGWQSVPVVFEKLEVKYPARAPGATSHDPFELTGRFRYEWEGREYRSDTLARKPIASGSMQELALRRRAMIRNEVDRAFVNQADPSEAIVERESLWSILFLALPLLFLFIGLACIVGGLGWSLPKVTRPKKRKYGISKSKLSVPQLWGGCLFLLLGCGMLLPMAIFPWVSRERAKGWVKTPCEIVWGRVKTHDSDDGDTYSVDILFRYEVEGKTHLSNEYSFVKGSSSGYKSKRAIVKQYPSGLQTSCFVDPRLPERAVLVMHLASLGYWWLLPAGFALLGAGMSVTGIFHRVNDSVDSHS